MHGIGSWPLPAGTPNREAPLPTDLLAELQKRATDRALAGGVVKARARCKSLYGFVQEAWKILEPGTKFVPGWHIEVICAHLEAVTWGTFLKLGLENRLLINIPPGQMKSLLVSVLWPAWEWGACGMAHLRYLSTSYSDLNVVRDTRKMRDLVETEWYRRLWPDVALIRRGEGDFENSKRGTRQGRPYPSLTGGRGDRLLIDDPHSTESAESDAERETALRIFHESVPSRINDPVRSAIVIIMQRLHQRDVSGAALELGGYIHVMLPMEFEPDRAFVSPLGARWSDPRKEAGELLAPGRSPRAAVERDKISLGSIGTAGQLQQRPVPRGGLMFKRAHFEIVAAAPAHCRRVRGWDLAATGEAEARKNKRGAASVAKTAATAGVLLSRDPVTKIFYIEDCVQGLWSPSQVRAAIVNTASQDGKAVEIDLPQDPGQAGKSQIGDLIGALAGYKAYGSPESGDKITRAMPVAAQVEAGNVKLVQGAWNKDFLDEIELFPLGVRKDRVDALSRAFGRHVTGGVSIASPPIVVVSARTYFGDHPGAYPD